LRWAPSGLNRPGLLATALLARVEYPAYEGERHVVTFGQRAADTGRLDGFEFEERLDLHRSNRSRSGSSGCVWFRAASREQAAD